MAGSDSIEDMERVNLLVRSNASTSTGQFLDCTRAQVGSDEGKGNEKTLKPHMIAFCICELSRVTRDTENQCAMALSVQWLRYQPIHPYLPVVRKCLGLSAPTGHKARRNV